mgnify:CR=1 FL=1
MKTKLFTPIFIVAIAIMAGINVFNAQKPAVLSDITMENVEALANGESETGYNCNNINGYRSWYVAKDPYSDERNERNQKKGSQDCCFKDKEGYLPSGDCKIG